MDPSILDEIPLGYFTTVGVLTFFTLAAFLWLLCYDPVYGRLAHEETAETEGDVATRPTKEGTKPGADESDDDLEDEAAPNCNAHEHKSEDEESPPRRQDGLEHLRRAIRKCEPGMTPRTPRMLDGKGMSVLADFLSETKGRRGIGEDNEGLKD